MSTRRARIKAVAALPPRRRNADNTDGKNKGKESFEKGNKSPRTPKSSVVSEEGGSPVRSAVGTPPALISATSSVATPDVLSPARVSAPTEDVGKVSTTHVAENESTTSSEKVPVITSAPSISVFASPRANDSPDKHRASPIVLSSPIAGSSELNDAPELFSPPPPITTEREICTQSTSTDKKTDIPDDYSIPSVPGSVTLGGIDGALLSPIEAGSLTRDPLKNEIAPEYAQISFEPIIALPSPSKVRPKLRPAPRLAHHRRNSIQGSASESEDESRRALLPAPPPPAPPRQRHDSHTAHNTHQSVPNRETNRVRNDSVCSSVSQVGAQPPVATSPVKEKHTSKARRQEMSRRAWRRKEVKREALTMYDLIFYNPTTNPLVPDQDEVNAKEANAKEEAERVTQPAESEQEPEASPADAAPVPQIKLGPNGEIILDEQSLVIKQSDANRVVSSVVREGAWHGNSYGRYTRAARTADWSAAETVRFYRALQALGTDFTLMTPLFPDRRRKDLYLKFKKEERLNGAQVDKALRSATSWDASRLQDEFQQEREEAARQARQLKQSLIDGKRAERERVSALRERRVRNSRAAKALESTMVPGVASQTLTGDEFVQRALETRAHSKKPRKAKPIQSPPAPNPPFATLTLNSDTAPENSANDFKDMATLSRVPTPNKHVSLNEVAGVPSNIETGSLVVLRVNDPKSPSKTMLQTYIAHGAGKLTPVALPPTFLNSVVGYMKKSTPKSTKAASSPQLLSPSSVTSQESRSHTPSVIQLNPCPVKRQRHNSYNITSL